MRSLIAALLAVALAGCSSPSVSSTPAAQSEPPPSVGSTAGSSAEPGASPGPTVSPPIGSSAPSAAPVSGQVFPPGAAVEVIVRDLNVRRNPSTSAKRLETLERGDVMIISPANQVSVGWGPVKADGYTWYPVMRPDVFDTDLKLDPLPKLPIDVGDGELFSGWIAADDGSQQYVAALPPRCPTTVDLLNVSGMLPAERLACFDEPIVLEGTFGCFGCGGVSFGTFKPVWLATPLELDFLSLDPSERFGPVALRFPPDGPSRPANGEIVRVTVHVDDPRASKCSMSEGDGVGGFTKIDDATAVLYCRERLVVDSFEVLGTDPDFPDG